MTIIDPPGISRASEAAWTRCEAATIAAMGAVNLATVRLVAVIVDLLASDGWAGDGVYTPEHWVMWKANVARHRAEGLISIARRRDELPVCWTAFAEGRLTEDAMARIARRVPASHDARVARLAPNLLISQLTRVLNVLPPLESDPPAPGHERYVRMMTERDGWGRGEWRLPPEEHAVVMAALTAGRDAEFRDRNDLAAGDEVIDADARSISWADGLVRLASDGADALDTTYQRTGHRGERNQIVLHHHVDAEGRFGPGRLHLGGFVDRDTARYLACEAQVIIVAWQDGKLLGINPAERTPNRRLRRALEHRDGGCAHPLCVQKLWLHAHHLQHWEDGGLTVAENLVMLCPRHHRGLHMGQFTIDGRPDDGTLVFRDAHGARIEPPALGADPLPPPPPEQLRYDQPYGGRSITRYFSWN
jgi:hypothetical protein